MQLLVRDLQKKKNLENFLIKINSGFNPGK